MLLTPLEQFQILSLLPIKFLYLDLSITNFFLINVIALTSLISLIYFISSHNNFLNESSFYFIPNSWQKLIESVYEVVAQLVTDTISSKNEQYFPIVSLVFSFILFSNIIGLLPYSFTTTSHLIVTFALSFSIFIGINIITFSKYNVKMFSLFLPANTTFFLAILLVPIEFISYIAKPVSLGMRLFINLMAGHSLLKIIIGFGWTMILLENKNSFGFIIPMVTLIILFGLELGVALIQTYVFTILTCIYIEDAT